MNKSSKKHQHDLKRKRKKAEAKRAELKKRKAERPLLTSVAHSIAPSKDGPQAVDDKVFNRDAWGIKNAEAK